MHRINRYGDIRSPCLTPLVSLNKPVGILLIRTERLEVEMQDMISCKRFCGMFMECSIILIKLHSMLSVKFDEHIWSHVFPHFMKECIISCVITLSVILLYRRKLRWTGNIMLLR